MNAVHTSRRSLLLAAIAAIGGSHVRAQSLVSDTISLVVPYPAGGVYDVVARALQPAMMNSLGKPVIIDNVGGASGSIGAQKTLATGASGRTILLASPNELSLAPLAFKSVKYKPSDFQLVGHLGTAPMVLFARPNLPVTDVEDLVRMATVPGAKPLTYASAGNGTIFHIVGANFAERMGVPMTHVPYRGSAGAIQDVASGMVDLAFFPTAPTFLQWVQAGRLKALGVAASSRHALLPSVPAFSEVPTLKDFYFDNWTGIFLAAGVEKAVAERIARAVHEAAATAEFKRVISDTGSLPGQRFSLGQAEVFYKNEVDRFERMARAAKLEADLTAKASNSTRDPRMRRFSVSQHAAHPSPGSFTRHSRMNAVGASEAA